MTIIVNGIRDDMTKAEFDLFCQAIYLWIAMHSLAKHPGVAIEGHADALDPARNERLIDLARN